MNDKATDHDWVSYAALGVSSFAFLEASRAKEEVNQLWIEIQSIKADINNQKYEREFQRWAEELIYQFSKTVEAISDSPANPVNDWADLGSFLQIVKENDLNTSVIRGFQNKRSFDNTLNKARQIIRELENTKEVRDHFCSASVGIGQDLR